jgi:hypothetical protein
MLQKIHWLSPFPAGCGCEARERKFPIRFAQTDLIGAVDSTGWILGDRGLDPGNPDRSLILGDRPDATSCCYFVVTVSAKIEATLRQLPPSTSWYSTLSMRRFKIIHP